MHLCPLPKCPGVLLQVILTVCIGVRSNAQCDCMLKPLYYGHRCHCSGCLQALNANGVHKLTAEVGQKLDPNQHEAMFDIPNPEAEPGTIAVIVKVGDLSQALSDSVHC